MRIKKTKLDNGLRIITIPMNTPTVTVLVLVQAGSKYETKKYQRTFTLSGAYVF